MLLNEMILYEKKHYIIVNDSTHDTFYYFDYDERNFSINMAFQHMHPFFEIMILLAPHADHLLDGKPYHLQCNDMILLPPHRLHRSIYPRGDASKRIIISFMLPENYYGMADLYQLLLSVFFAEIPIYRFDQDDQHQLYDCLNDLFLYSRRYDCSTDPIHSFYVHTKFQEFLLTLYNLRGTNRYRNENVCNPTEQKMYEIAAYIHTHYAEDLTLDSLSKQFFVSTNYLSHQFKSVLSFNLTTYIQMIRIKNVQYLLNTTNEKISEIAATCGFNSFSQFNRIFQKIVGMSPSDFRKNGSLTD